MSKLIEALAQYRQVHLRRRWAYPGTAPESPDQAQTRMALKRTLRRGADEGDNTVLFQTETFLRVRDAGAAARAFTKRSRRASCWDQLGIGTQPCHPLRVASVARRTGRSLLPLRSGMTVRPAVHRALPPKCAVNWCRKASRTCTSTRSTAGKLTPRRVSRPLA